MRTKEITSEDLAGMSVAKQIHLAQDILNNLAHCVGHSTSILTAEQRTEIDRRRKELRENPGSAIPREQVLADLKTL